jgi:ABC-type transport system involved in Fe-S cluster assembly fused permease/ATPase subunit
VGLPNLISRMQDPRRASSGPLRALRPALRLLWTTADGRARRQLLLALGLVVAGAVLAATTPILLKLLVDSFSSTGAAMGYGGPFVLVVLYVLGQYVWRCSTEARLFVHGQAEQRIRRHLGLKVFAHLVRLPLRYHLERRAGAVAETAHQGLRGYELLLFHITYTLLPVTVEFAAVAIVLIHFGYPIYLLILALASVAYLAAFHRGAVAARAASEDIVSAQVDAQASLIDILINQETVKYFNAEGMVCEHYDTALARVERVWREFFRRRAVNGILIATVFSLSLGVALFLAVRDLTQATITVGDFVLINTYVMRLIQPLELLGVAVRDVSQALALLGNMLEILKQQPEDAIGAQCQTAAAHGELRFENVSFAYEQERQLLQNVTFHVHAGARVAVVGVSGSGKSSLIRLLFRLYEPDSGRILLNGVPIASMPLPELRRAIAIVPQDTVLFHASIGANIAFGKGGCTRAEIERAARIANLHELIGKLPQGYDTLVGERGLKLSGGERQRVAIARAAIKNPQIFIFDEATSSLDSRTEREILRNLADLSSRSTTLVIAHRLSTVEDADQILVLHEGMIIERGTHAELRARNGHYAALWNAQQTTASQKGQLRMADGVTNSSPA